MKNQRTGGENWQREKGGGQKGGQVVPIVRWNPVKGALDPR